MGGLWACSEDLQRFHGGPGVCEVNLAGKFRPRLVGKSSVGPLAGVEPGDSVGLLFCGSAEDFQGLEAPEGIHDVAIAAVGCGEGVEASVVTASSDQIVDKGRVNVFEWQAEQLAAGEGRQLKTKDGISIFS